MTQEKWNSYFKFCFVRNPWSRTVSLYHYHRQSPKQWPLAQKSFEEWLLEGGTGTIKKSLTDFVTDEDGNDIIDFVGRYENLKEDFSEICSRLDLPELTLPHLNKSKTVNYRSMYTNETRDLVAKWPNEILKNSVMIFKLKRLSLFPIFIHFFQCHFI